MKKIIYCLLILMNVNLLGKENSDILEVKQILKNEYDYRITLISSKLTKILKNCETLHNKYPESANIAGAYAYIYRYVKRDNLKAIQILLPYMHKSQESPYLRLYLWRIFYSPYLNINNTFPDSKFQEMLMNKYTTPKKSLLILNKYFVKQVDMNFVPDWLKGDVIKAKKLEIKDSTPPIIIWQGFVEKLGHYQNFSDRIQLQKENANKTKQEREKRAKLIQDQYQKNFDNAVKKLDALLTPPNSLSKMELLFAGVPPYSRIIKKYKNIPNYKKLKAKYTKSNEAEIINIGFQAYILRTYAKCLQEIAKQSNKDTDERLLSIKVFCMQMEKYDAQLIIKELNKILKIAPKNHKAFMLKRMLKARLEKEKLWNKS